MLRCLTLLCIRLWGPTSSLAGFGFQHGSRGRWRVQPGPPKTQTQLVASIQTSLWRRCLGGKKGGGFSGDALENVVDKGVGKLQRRCAQRCRWQRSCFFSQAKTQVSQTWIYKSVEFINCINFPCAAGSRILETSTGCVVVINKWSEVQLWRTTTIWVFMSKKISYDSPLLSEYSCLDMVVYSLPTFVEVYWSAGGDERCLPGYEGRIGKVT